MSDPTPHTPPVSDAAEDLPRDPRTGRFAPGHLVNQKHGTLTLERRGPSPELAAEMAAYEAQCLADLGGAEEITAIKRRLLHSKVIVDTMIVFLGEYLLANGPLTPRGRQRSSVGTLLGCCATSERLARTLGLERKTKRLASVMDVLNAPEDLE